MRTLRYLFAWYFFILCVLTAAGGIAFGLTIRKIADPSPLKISVATEIAMILAGLVFGRASWVLWHEKLAAKVWCTAACVISLIIPAFFLIVYLLGPRREDFWKSAVLLSFFTVPVAIGIGGILLGFSDAAKPLEPSVRPHPGHSIVTSILLLIVVGNFIYGAVKGVQGFIRHKHLSPMYFIVLAAFALGSCLLVWVLRRELRERGKPSEVTTA